MKIYFLVLNKLYTVVNILLCVRIIASPLLCLIQQIIFLAFILLFVLFSFFTFSSLDPSFHSLWFKLYSFQHFFLILNYSLIFSLSPIVLSISPFSIYFDFDKCLYFFLFHGVFILFVLLLTGNNDILRLLCMSADRLILSLIYIDDKFIPFQYFMILIHR